MQHLCSEGLPFLLLPPPSSAAWAAFDVSMDYCGFKMN